MTIHWFFESQVPDLKSYPEVFSWIYYFKRKQFWICSSQQLILALILCLFNSLLSSRLSIARIQNWKPVTMLSVMETEGLALTTTRATCGHATSPHTHSWPWRLTSLKQTTSSRFVTLLWSKEEKNKGTQFLAFIILSELRRMTHNFHISSTYCFWGWLRDEELLCYTALYILK